MFVDIFTFIRNLFLNHFSPFRTIIAINLNPCIPVKFELIESALTDEDIFNFERNSDV